MGVGGGRQTGSQRELAGAGWLVGLCGGLVGVQMGGELPGHMAKNGPVRAGGTEMPGVSDWAFPVLGAML